MAAANFSRDDLIDLETVLENPPLYMECKHNLGDYRNLKKGKPHYHCDWLKIGKKERCGKPCEQFYCHNHGEYINRGGTIPLPCLCCGEGTIQYNQLCLYWEIEYGVERK